MRNNLQRRISFGLFEFDAATGELRRDGVVVKLAPQPARVLALLVSRPGEVISRDDLRRELWGEETFVDFERGVNFCITQARAALGDSSDNPRFIQTVPRRGYRFIAPVTAVPAPTSIPTARGVPPWGGQSPTEGTGPASGDRPLEPSPGPRPGVQDATLTSTTATNAASATTDTARTTWPAWAVLVGIAMIATSAWWALGKRPNTTAAAGAQPAVRVVVLPFANLTGDTQLDYVVDGLTDEVITQLGSLSRDRLAVIARTSAMTYRSTEKPVSQIARDLDVQYVVEGSVRREGNALRISSSFVPVTEGAAVSWSNDVFDSTSLTLDARQTPAAIRIARHVATQLLTDTDAVATPHASVNAAAWDAFMQASASLHRGTPDDIKRAVEQLEAAVREDDSFAAAWARLAEARHLLVMMGVVAPKDAYPAAEAAARRALASRPDLPAAHLAQGLVDLWYNWRPLEAAASFERAIALNPSLAAAHHDYAWALVALGRTDEAIRHISRARDLDPLSTRANNDVGWLHLFVRQPEQAARACEHTLAIDNGSLEAQACLERAYAQRELFDAALHAARTTLRRSDDGLTSATGETGLREIWRWRLRQLEGASDRRWINPYTLAVHYSLIHDREHALDALESAYDHRVGMMVFLARDPALDPLRGHPRFELLLKKVTRRTS